MNSAIQAAGIADRAQTNGDSTNYNAERLHLVMLVAMKRALQEIPKQNKGQERRSQHVVILHARSIAKHQEVCSPG